MFLYFFFRYYLYAMSCPDMQIVYRSFHIFSEPGIHPLKAGILCNKPVISFGKGPCYMKSHFSQSTYGNRERHPEVVLLDALKKTRYDLEIAYEGFNYAVDPELIDCYIYEVAALCKRYNYLLRQLPASRCKKPSDFLPEGFQFADFPTLSDAETAAVPLVGQVLV